MAKLYIFNVQTTIELVADSEDEAYNRVPGLSPFPKDSEDYKIIDNDVQLVDVEDIPDE